MTSGTGCDCALINAEEAVSQAEVAVDRAYLTVAQQQLQLSEMTLNYWMMQSYRCGCNTMAHLSPATDAILANENLQKVIELQRETLRKSRETHQKLRDHLHEVKELHKQARGG